MPNPADHANVIPQTKTRGRKHRTKAEIDARRAAAEGLELKAPAKLFTPAWMPPAAQKIWKRKVAEIQKLKSPDTLLYDLDSDVFSAWCINVMNFQKLARKNGSTEPEDYNLMIRLTQRIHDGADKLGFTPASRARLIRKRADEGDKDNFGKEFD